ncbi:hypothetical protein O3Q51_14075 [Cryomorphaceae bacterium 1068]|nr:hypothetical protein [Cryomorphaceae bacterium 1068]
MSEKSNRAKFYIIPWALSAAFLIRAMILRDSAATYATDNLSIWQSTSFYFVLSSVGFILGLYFLTRKGGKSESD